MTFLVIVSRVEEVIASRVRPPNLSRVFLDTAIVSVYNKFGQHYVNHYWAQTRKIILLRRLQSDLMKTR